MQEDLSSPRTHLSRNKFEFAWDMLSRNPMELFLETSLAINDLQRAGVEWMKLVRSPIIKGDGLPRGSGSIVILPGFMTPSFMYRDTKRVFDSFGYDTHIYEPKWGLNVIPVEQQLDRSIDFIDKIPGKVTLIGHSKGGLLAFALYAVRRDWFFEKVGHIITVGAPRPSEVNFGIGTPYLGTQFIFRGDDFKFANEVLSKVDTRIDGAFNTAIGAENDPIIRGDLLGEIEEQVIIPSSHMGLLVNVDVNSFIVRRMAEVNTIDTEAA